MHQKNILSRTILVGLSFLFLTPRIAQADLFSGTYIVTAPKSLANVSVFDMEYISWNKEGDKESLKYTLPEDLVGKPSIKITLDEVSRSENGAVQFKGKLGCATCLTLKTRIVCSIRYSSDLLLNWAKVEAFLHETYQENEGRLDRLDLARFFNKDPGGVLTVFIPN